MTAVDDRSPQRFYHGTKADLRPGDLIEPGYKSNYGKRKKAAYVYLTATGEVADWQGHAPEELRAMRDHLERLKELGVEAIED